MSREVDGVWLPDAFRPMPGTTNIYMVEPHRFKAIKVQYFAEHLAAVGCRYIDGTWYDLYKVVGPETDLESVGVDNNKLSYFDPEVERKANIAKLLRACRTYDEWVATKQAIKEGRI